MNLQIGSLMKSGLLVYCKMCEGSGNSQCSTQILLDPFIPCTVDECSLFQPPPPQILCVWGFNSPPATLSGGLPLTY